MISLSDIPPGFYHSLVIIGALGILASYFLRLFPLVNLYFVPLQFISIILLVVGIYWSGATANEAKWKSETAKLRNDVLLAEERARSISSKVEYVFLDKVQQVKEVQFIVQEKLKDISVTIDSQCKVAPDAVELVNSAAKNTLPKDKK